MAEVVEAVGVLSEAERKRTGAFYTPDDVAGTLVRWAARRPSEMLLDPSCGDGRFLAAHRRSVGVEQNAAEASKAAERAPWARIHRDDFFRWAGEQRQRFDCAAGNPPFIRYQMFAGEVRQRALALCGRLGAPLSALTSSWAPFLVATASLLKPGGRMAFVVPAEIGHATYAEPLVRYLTSRFRRVQVVAVLDKVFPSLSEDVWFLFADGYEDRTDHVLLTRRERFSESDAPPSDGLRVRLDEWEGAGCRLRPFLLPSDARRLYERLRRHPSVARLGTAARVGIGYVTGANDFFHVRPSTAKAARIPQRLLYAAVRNGAWLPEDAVTRPMVRAWLRADEPVLLLRLRKNDAIPPSVAAYLDSEDGRRARATYKCRNRDPWYVVPDVQVPDAFLSYMSDDFPALIANPAGCVCTNSVHAVRMRDGFALRDLVATWNHPLVQMSCEVEGHPLGGGLLKLEPGEAACVLVPRRGLDLGRPELRTLEDGVAEMRRWRHHA